MTRLLLLLPALLLLTPGPAEAKRKPKAMPAPALYERVTPTITTVEFSQEFVAGGQKQQSRGFTDGVVVSPDGLVLISGRVRFPQQGSTGRLAGGSLPALGAFRLFFSDGREHKAEVVRFDDDLNLGVLRVTDLAAGERMPHVVFHPGFEPQVGDALRSMTLYTQDYGRKPVYQGLGVSALIEKPQAMWSLSGATNDLLGAPVFDAAGRAVGVIAQVPMSPWAGRQVVPELSGPVGLAYDRFSTFLIEARKSAAAAAEAAVAQETPEAPPAAEEDPDAGWLGVQMQALERNLAEHLGVSSGGGVVVSRVLPGSPAEAAGVQPLDVLTTIDGERIPVTSESDLPVFAQLIRAKKAGTELVFVRESRAGKEELRVALARPPKSELHAERRSDPDFELGVREITLDVRIEQRLPDATGVVVDSVTRAGWAGLSRIGTGYILQRINDMEVTDLDSFEAAMAKVKAEKPGQVLFFARYRSSTFFFVAEPEWSDEGGG